MKKTENMKKTKYRKLQDRRKDYVHLHSIIPTYQSPAVRSCFNILYTMHFPHCPSPSVNGCVSPVSWYDPSQNLLLMPSSGIFLRCATLTFLISLELLEFSLSFSVSLSFCLPLSRSLFIYYVFYLPRVPQSQTSWLWTAFFLPLWGLTSHSRPWVFLPEGSWATEVW